MKWLRFSIASLMALTVYAALGCAAFSKVDDYWYGRLLDDAYYMVTILALAIATIMAVLSRGRGRARWLGFAVFGWVHLLFGWPDSGGSPQAGGTYRPRFPHMTLINWVISSHIAPGQSTPFSVDAVTRNVLPALRHAEQGNFTWHVIQTTATIVTAVIARPGGQLPCEPSREQGSDSEWRDACLIKRLCQCSLITDPARMPRPAQGQIAVANGVRQPAD